MEPAPRVERSGGEWRGKRGEERGERERAAYLAVSNSVAYLAVSGLARRLVEPEQEQQTAHCMSKMRSTAFVIPRLAVVPRC